MGRRSTIKKETGHGSSSSSYMSIRKYRLAQYDTTLSNFWNGKLQLAYLNNIQDTNLDIQQYQLMKIEQYQRSKTGSKDTQEVLDNLNYDIQSYFKSYNSNGVAVVNQVIDDLANKINDLYGAANGATFKGENAEEMTEEQAQELLAQVNQMYVLYGEILKLLMDYQKQPMIAKYLETFHKEFNNLVDNMPFDKKTLANFSGKGYIGKLGGLSIYLKGYIGEEALVKEGISKLPVPIGIKNTGTLGISRIVNGEKKTVQGPADFIVYSMTDLDLAKDIEIEYQLGQDKTKLSCSIYDFMTKVLQDRSVTVSVTEGQYKKLCENALATIQAKFFKKNVSQISFKTPQKFSQIERNFNTEHIRALKSMLELNKVSAKGNNEKSKYLYQDYRYQNFINYSLGSNVGFIFGGNAFMLTGEKGIETVWDFTRRKFAEGYMLKWGTAKAFNLRNIERDAARNIVLTRI